MVAHMVIRADAVEVELSLVEGPVAPWSARCEELRWAEVAARNDAGLWKSRFETSRKHLTAAVEEMKAVRRAAKDALFLQAEVARLTKLLSDAGVEPGKRRARVSLSQAVRELKQQQNTIKSLSRENTRLRKGAKASQNRIETLRIEMLAAQLTQLTRDPGGAVEDAVRAQERAAGDAALRTPAWSAARCRRPWPHPTVRAGRAHGRAPPASGYAHVFVLRQAVRGEWHTGLEPHRDRGQSPHACDSPSALAPDLHLHIVTPGSVGPPGAAPVRQHTLRDQRVGAVFVRALCLLAPAGAGRRVAVRPGPAAFARHAGRQRGPLCAAVRAARRGDPGTPERGDAAPRRRDGLAHPVAS